eukprot:6580536-Ditylum_brightwellii.AAC.2
MTKLVYQVFVGDLDEVHSFMQISHGTRDHAKLTAQCVWAVFKMDKETQKLGGLRNSRKRSRLQQKVKYLQQSSKQIRLWGGQIKVESKQLMLRKSKSRWVKRS